MRLDELLRLVRINTLQNKGKVLLTSLGIIVGTATIVLVTAIGQGAKKDAEAQYSGLSADTIFVNLDYQQLNDSFDTSGVEPITPEIMESIREENPYLSAICLRNENAAQARVGRKEDYLSVAGVTEGYSEVFTLSIEYGTDFSPDDFENGARVAVIGGKAAEKYFGDSADAVGQRIKLKDDMFTVIGVIKSSGDGLQGISHDDSVYIPYNAMLESGIGDKSSLPQLAAKAASIRQVDSAIRRMQSSLQYYLQSPQYYRIEDAGSRIETATRSARTMSMLLVSVAMIVLTVGGIGIMNVLFVTIKDRTREIGVLKALGAPSRMILLQFLLESVSIGAVGGALGLACSAVGLWLLRFSGMPLAPSVPGAGVAFLFALITSAVFGFYPAYKASQLKPVDALSYE